MIGRYSLPAMTALWTEEAKFGRWLRVELAVSEQLAERGELPAEDMTALRERSAFDVAEIEAIEKETNHDVIAFVTCVARNVGEAGRHLHRGLTSSDVVDTAWGIALKEGTALVLVELENLALAVRELSETHARTPMAGRTHGVHAEPTTFGLKVAVWFQELLRHRRRLEAALEAVSVGAISGPVGTYSMLPPEIEAGALARLGLTPAPVSTQIIQRDRHAELVCALAQVGATMDKIALELRNLARTEVREVEEPFGRGQKGSSAMPHKKNPILCERICGLARCLRGYAVTALEDVALWHERDISHSSAERVILPDALTLTHYLLVKLRGVVSGLRVFPERMLQNLRSTRGLLHSAQVLDALVGAGLQREAAYAIVQPAGLRTLDDPNTSLREELWKNEAVQQALGEAALDACFDLEPYLRHVDTILGRALTWDGPRHAAAAAGS